MKRIRVYCVCCGGDCTDNYSLRGPAGRPYHFGCLDKEPPMPPHDPRAGRGYYEEDAPGYDEAS